MRIFSKPVATTIKLCGAFSGIIWIFAIFSGNICQIDSCVCSFFLFSIVDAASECVSEKKNKNKKRTHKTERNIIKNITRKGRQSKYNHQFYLLFSIINLCSFRLIIWFWFNVLQCFRCIGLISTCNAFLVCSFLFIFFFWICVVVVVCRLFFFNRCLVFCEFRIRNSFFSQLLCVLLY